jgi:hypothetical protein
MPNFFLVNKKLKTKKHGVAKRGETSISNLSALDIRPARKKRRCHQEKNFVK